MPSKSIRSAPNGALRAPYIQLGSLRAPYIQLGSLRAPLEALSIDLHMPIYG